MAGPQLPDADPLTGDERITVRQAGRARGLLFSVLRAWIGAGPKGDPGPKGDKGDQGVPGVPKRVETYTTTKSSAAGLAQVTFAPAFASLPTVLPGMALVGSQVIYAVPSNVTVSGCDVTLVRSKGTLLLTAGPFEPAPGVTGIVVAIGN